MFNRERTNAILIRKKAFLGVYFSTILSLVVNRTCKIYALTMYGITIIKLTKKMLSLESILIHLVSFLPCLLAIYNKKHTSYGLVRRGRPEGVPLRYSIIAYLSIMVGFYELRATAFLLTQMRRSAATNSN